MSFCESIGCLTIFLLLALFIYKIGKFFWVSYFASFLGYGYNFKHPEDAFAVITGATDGIGLAYAEFFAKKKYKLFLISRNSQKLADTKAAIEAKYKNCNEIRVHEADFSKTDIYEGIREEINKLPRVEVLVNNVGLSYQYAEYLTKIPDSWETIDSLLKVNIYSCTRMIQIVLPIMESQKKGLILNLSSFSAAYPTPLLAVYGAAKTYIDYFSRALQFEYASKNIVIQSILPAYVSTKMSKIRKTSLLVPSPKNYVESQMRTVGLERRTYGFWTHKIQGFLLDFVVFNLLGNEYVSKITYDSLKRVRAKVYKKFGLKNE